MGEGPLKQIRTARRGFHTIGARRPCGHGKIIIPLHPETTKNECSMEENREKEGIAWARNQLKMAMEELGPKSVGERARDQVVLTLRKMHCLCDQISAENMSFYFDGEEMLLRHYKNSPFIKIYYWIPQDIPLDDTERVEKAKWLVNRFNMEATSCMSYYVFEELGCLAVEISHNFRILFPRTQGLEDYLRSTLWDILSMSRKFESKMDVDDNMAQGSQR